jgi:putative Mn2+ efflux pump MntP
MGLIELLLISVGLAMDAFAVSVGKGMTLKSVRPRHALTAGVWFGVFQGLMPMIGYFVGQSFGEYVVSVDHWIAVGLLTLIGVNMIREAVSDEEEEVDGSFGVRTMFVMAIATSIDAMAAGVTFATLGEQRITLALSLIGGVTFLFCFIGAAIGAKVGEKWRTGATVAGGVILILLGIKVLIEHLITLF